MCRCRYQTPKAKSAAWLCDSACFIQRCADCWADFSLHSSNRSSQHTHFQNRKTDECKSPTVPITQKDEAVLHNVKKLPESSVITPVSPVTPQLESQLPSPPAYHIFNRSRKLELVFIVSLAAIFSPLSSNIYSPTLGDVPRVSLKTLSPFLCFHQLGLLRSWLS